MDQISGWARLQDEATGVIRQLGEGNAKPRGEGAEGEDRRKGEAGGGDHCLVVEDGHHHQETYGRECHAPHQAQQAGGGICGCCQAAY